MAFLREWVGKIRNLTVDLMQRSRKSGCSSECALLLIDYQENVLDLVFEQDQRVVELNARTLAKAALDFNIPVILSTVGVEMGVNSPTIASLKAALPNVTDIDRSSMNAWEDANFAFAALGLIWGSNFIVAIVEQLNFKSTG